MSNPAEVSDGDFSSIEEIDGVSTEFPFLQRQVPDLYMRVHRRPFEIDRRFYSPYLLRRAAPSVQYRRTNYLLRSFELEHAAWSVSNVTAGAYGHRNPWDGAATARFVGETIGSGPHIIGQSVMGLVPGSRASLWAVVSANAIEIGAGRTARKNCMLLAYDGFVESRCFFDLDAGTCGGGTGGAGGVIALGGGWYLCWVDFVVGVGATYFCNLHFLNDDGELLYPGTANCGQLVAHMQLECEMGDATALLPFPGRPGARVDTQDLAASQAYPAIDSDDPFAFLLGEDALSPAGGDVVRVVRKFGRVPVSQVDFDFIEFSRPVMHDIVVSGRYAVTFDEGITSHVFSSRKAVSTWGGLNANTRTRTGTVDQTGTIGRAGTLAGEKQSFTGDNLPAATVTVINDAGLSTTFNLSSSGSSIATTLGAAGILITAQCTKTPGSLNILVDPSSTRKIKSMDCSDASVLLSGSGSNFTFTRRQTSAYNDVTNDVATVDTRALSGDHDLLDSYLPADSIRSISVTSHGGNVGDLCVLWMGDKVLGTTRVVSVPNANTFGIPLKDFPGKDDVVTHVQFAKNGTRYKNGSKSVRHRITDDFWLLGYNNSYASAGDIPGVTKQTDAITWLGLIAASTSWAVADVGRTESFMGLGPLITRRKVEIEMANALETVDPAA